MITVRRRLVALVLAGAASAALASACDGSSGDSSDTTPAGAASLPALTSTGKAVPGPLDELEAQSEDIIDVVPGGGWDDVATDVQTVDDAWGRYEAEAADDGAPTDVLDGITSSIDALDRASAAKDPSGTMQAANDLSAGVVELFGLYEVGRPVGIGRLDVIGRQIVLDAAASDSAGVDGEIAHARREWSAIESDIADHDGQPVIEETNTLLDALSEQAAAGDFSAVTASAQQLLEVVDAMEQLY